MNCNNGFGGCWWIIILILLFCCCGNSGFSNNGCGCGCDNLSLIHISEPTRPY